QHKVITSDKVVITLSKTGLNLMQRCWTIGIKGILQILRWKRLSYIYWHLYIRYLLPIVWSSMSIVPTMNGYRMKCIRRSIKKRHRPFLKLVSFNQEKNKYETNMFEWKRG